MKLKHSNYDKKLKLWQNSRTQIVMQLKWWQNSKTQIVTKLKKNQIVTKLKKKSYCDKTQKLKMGSKKIVELWQNLSCDKTQIVTKLKLGQKSSCDKAQIGTKIKLWRKTFFFKSVWKTQIVTELENSNYDKTQKLKLWQNLKYDQSKLKTFF